MKPRMSVRRPSLAHSSLSRTSEEKIPVGDVLRKAQRDLLLKRICYGLLIVILIALIVAGVVMGYAAQFVDWFYALLG
ncbi:MAG: hypothetical protein IKT14_03495 [Clostridiales bacterium]|nr:hypothetical protein [Clostridiales bacterium]MBR6484062.1 hypothetical protein [Clostridiales bacterium]